MSISMKSLQSLLFSPLLSHLLELTLCPWNLCDIWPLCSSSRTNLCSSVSTCLWRCIARALSSFLPKMISSEEIFFLNKVVQICALFRCRILLLYFLFVKLIRRKLFLRCAVFSLIYITVNWWSKSRLSIERLIQNETGDIG